MTNVTCGLTAKKPESSPCPTLVIKYGTTLLYFAYQSKRTDGHTFLVPVTLTLTWWPWCTNFDLDILKMYLHTNGEVSRSRLSKVRARTDKRTETQTHATENITRPHSRAVGLIIKLAYKHVCSSLVVCRAALETPSPLSRSWPVYATAVRRRRQNL